MIPFQTGRLCLSVCPQASLNIPSRGMGEGKGSTLVLISRIIPHHAGIILSPHCILPWYNLKTAAFYEWLWFFLFFKPKQHWMKRQLRFPFCCLMIWGKRDASLSSWAPDPNFIWQICFATGTWHSASRCCPKKQFVIGERWKMTGKTAVSREKSTKLGGQEEPKATKILWTRCFFLG